MVDGQDKKTFFSLIQDFYGIVVDFDKELKWKKVETNQNGQKNLCTAMVYG